MQHHRLWRDVAGTVASTALVLLASCTGEVAQGPQAANGSRTAADGASEGSGKGAGAQGAGESKACRTGGEELGATPLRRLSSLELQLTLQDLFQLPSPPSIESIPLDTDKEGFKTYAELQPVSAQHLRAYADVAAELGDALLADGARRRKVLGCEPSESDCLRGFVTRFGKLAYRRPLEASELDALVARAESNGLDLNDQFRFALQSMLSSANFLYRVEIGDDPDGQAKLSPNELAAKLSFASWGRAPSAELLDRAADGELSSDEGLRRAARQMLDDPRSKQFYGAFFRQWLGYDQLRAPATPPSGWSDGLLDAMQAETDSLALGQAFGAGSLLDALTSDRVQLTPELARFYGLPAPDANGNVTIPANHARAGTGLLGHASLLSAKGDGDLIAIRGNWLRRTFLCSTLEVPPDVAEELGELLVGLTRVEIVEKRNTEQACKGCHAQIDPIGVGLSQFDALGRFDAKANLDMFGIAPALPDADEPSFASVAELSAKLQAMPEVATCLAEKAFIYLHGRAPEPADACELENASASFAKGGYRFRELLEGMLSAPSFRLRRAPPVL